MKLFGTNISLYVRKVRLVRCVKTISSMTILSMRHTIREAM